MGGPTLPSAEEEEGFYIEDDENIDDIASRSNSLRVTMATKHTRDPSVFRLLISWPVRG